jgi:CelD/BcsL family acetyltransferase involved in cellulose biosynthesis
MRVTVVRGDIASLECEWISLFASDPEAAPFLSFQWLSAWCRHWSSGGSPWVLIVHEGERLAGLAPFMMSHRGGMRLLRGMGVGVGNSWNVIAAPEDREQVVVAVAQTLKQRSSEWDALFVDKLPEESGTEAALIGVGLRVDRRTRWPSPRIALPETFDAYLAGLSKNRRWRMRRNLQAVDNGDLVIRTVSDPNELREAIARWQRLRVEWWEKRERPMNPEHGSKRFLAFTEEAIMAMVPAGLAVVCEVRYHDEPVGITLDFLDASTFYYWLWGFDPRFEELRPGHTLIAYGIRWSIETGRRYYDLMIGDEPYKYDYAPVDRALLSMTFGNHRLRSRAALGLSSLRHAVLPAGRRIPVLGRNV